MGTRFRMVVSGLRSRAGPLDGAADGKWDTEFRVTSTFMAKIFDSAFAGLGIGQRTSADQSRPDLFASIFVTYDSDQLFEQLMTTMAK